MLAIPAYRKAGRDGRRFSVERPGMWLVYAPGEADFGPGCNIARVGDVRLEQRIGLMMLTGLENISSSTGLATCGGAHGDPCAETVIAPSTDDHGADLSHPPVELPSRRWLLDALGE